MTLNSLRFPARQSDPDCTRTMQLSTRNTAMITATETAATLIADFRAAADEIEAILAPTACATVASHNWIVVDDFGPMTFTLTLEGGKHRATCTGHGRAHKVNRFTREDAERLAQACNARAVFWRDAAEAEAATLRGHIATLEAASAA
jgi:hypothetical protein